MARGRLLLIGGGMLAILVVALVLSLGTDGGAPSAGVDLAEAANRTIRAGGAEIQTQTKLTPQGPIGASQALTMPGKGFVDSSGEHMVLDMDMSALKKAAGKEVDLEGAENVRAAYDYPVMYMRWPALASRIEFGKSWIKIDYSKILGEAGVDMSLFDAENYNPSQQLRFLRAAGGKVERLGDEDIRGMHTVHYKGEVDIRRYPDLVPPAERAQARRSAEKLTKLTGDPVDPVEVWIGDDGLVRRMRTSWDQEVGKMTATREETIDYVSFGKRFAIKPPPKKDTVDLTRYVLEGKAGG